MKSYFSMDAEDVIKDLNVTKEGLSGKAVEEKRKSHGLNELVEAQKKGIVAVFFEQFKDILVIILLAAAIISALAGNLESTIVIFAVIILNAILGTVQHVKAEQSLNSLKALSSPSAKVVRDGKRIEIPSKEVVPSDILVLETGDFIAADGRIIENYSLQVNESSLTGESESATKCSDTITETEIALGDQKNMVFSGSLVTYGRAFVAVTGTGMDTEIGKIARLLDSTDEKKTPLQVSLDDFSKKLAFIILGICAIVFGLSMYREMPVLDSLMFAVALAVAAIPEALGSIVTIVLAIGTQKMAKENAIIKKLRAVEGLGSVSIICSDKTGTLTQNKMKVRNTFVDDRTIDYKDYNLDNNLENKLIRCAVLCNDSMISEEKEIGDPTEIALVDLARNYDIDELELRDLYERISEIPFDSERKLMSTTHKMYGKHIMFTKGAVDVLLPRVTTIESSKGVTEFTEQDKMMIENKNKEFSENGLRVLAFAYKEIDDEHFITLEDESDYTFLGLISMIDPPREESKGAVADCISAGIKPIMITGDHKITASAIATQIGILRPGDEAINGVELDKLDDEQLSKKVETVSVYARVSPEHKIRIVDAWQKKGHIVGMTGDGVNDAPALKQADIGIAMGITGTEVSKDAASMILTDDNFATIVKAIANGRNVYTNIKNAIRFLLSGNTAGILSVLYTSILALPIPFEAVHLLFINLLTDSLPAIAIGVESPKGDLLKEKPRDSKSSLLSKDFLLGIMGEGIIITVFTLIAYHIGLKTEAHVASTMAFATLCLARLFHGFNCRGKKSIFKLGVFSNKYSWIAFFIGAALLTLVLTVAPLKSLFAISDLTMYQFQMIYLLAFIPTVIIQLYKVIFVDRR